MTALPLPGLAVVVAGLLGLGPVAWIGGAWLAARGAFVLCLLGAVLALAALLGDAPPPVLEVPVGLPGSGILLALDGVSALFLLALFVAGAAASAAAIQSEGRATAPLLPVLIGALTTTLLAADGFSITLAFEVATLAIAALTAGGAAGWRPAATLVGGGVCCGLCLVSVMALLAPLQPWGLDLSFAGMRAQPVEGWRATAVLLLVLLGAGGAAGLAPLHRWLATAQAGIAGADGALLCGAVGAVGLYVIVRVLFDLAGPAQPGWWGGLLVLLGAAGALLAAARSARTGDIRTVAGAAAAARGGLAALAVGLALAARAADLAPLAALALAAALLLMLAQATGGTLLALAVASAEAGAGTRHLDRLGGLLRGMPFTTLCALVGGLGLAALPPSLGFAAAWTLVQALIGAARLGGLGWQALATLATLVAALTGTLGAVAAVRLLGVGFLGRPRTPRAAAAQESARPVRGAMLVLAGLSLLAGVFPGLLLALAEPALRRLLGVGMADRAGLFTISPVPEAPGLAAAGVAALLVLATIATHRALRLRASVGHHAGAVWEGGAAPPPPWLPFGDPATQIGPAAFAEPLGNVLATARPAAVSRLRPMLRRWRQAVDRADAALRPSARGALAALLATVVVVLLAVVLADRP